MKQFGIAILVAVGLILVACGGGSSSGSNAVTGNWTATLTNTNGTPAFAFTTSLTQSNGSTVTGANLTFTASTGCFTSAASQTGSFVLSGNLQQYYWRLPIDHHVCHTQRQYAHSAGHREQQCDHRHVDVNWIDPGMHRFRELYADEDVV